MGFKEREGGMYLCVHLLDWVCSVLNLCSWQLCVCVRPHFLRHMSRRQSPAWLSVLSPAFSPHSPLPLAALSSIPSTALHYSCSVALSTSAFSLCVFSTLSPTVSLPILHPPSRFSCFLAPHLPIAFHTASINMFIFLISWGATHLRSEISCFILSTVPTY